MQHRIIIIGTSCSGKSTLAKHLKKKLVIPHIEMDHLYWAPDWRPVPPEDFQQKVAMSVKSESWIVDGNYSSVRDLI
jgi:adenylate kinase family enzyme